MRRTFLRWNPLLEPIQGLTLPGPRFSRVFSADGRLGYNGTDASHDAGLPRVRMRCQRSDFSHPMPVVEMMQLLLQEV